MNEYHLAKFKEAVAFLYREQTEPRGEGLRKEPIGTCFFVVAATANEEHRSAYLVTARHVLNDLRNGDGGMFVRLNEPPPGATKKPQWWERQTHGVRYVPLPHNGWIEHPNAGVDLAVLPWSPSQDFDLTVSALPLRDLKTHYGNLRRTWPPHEGVETVMVGLMLQHQGVERNLPIVRMGHVALNTDERIALTSGYSLYRIIQMQAFRGNSGAPVWTRYTGEYRDLLADVRPDKREWKPAEEFAFLGVLATAFASEFEISRRGNVETYLNYGISAVVPGEILVTHIESLEADRQ